MVYNIDQISKREIGGMIELAKKYGINLESWPSGIPANTDGRNTDRYLRNIREAKPIKLVSRVGFV